VNLDENSLYSVVLTSEIDLPNELVIASGQITLKVQNKGFKIDYLNSINGDWFEDVDRKKEYTNGIPNNDYFFIRLRDAGDLGERGLFLNEEITLFTFKNVGACSGPVELITSEDDLINLNEANRQKLYHDLNTWDTKKGLLYNISSIYDVGSAICDSLDVFSPSDSLPSEPIDTIISPPNDSIYDAPETDFDISVTLNEIGIYEVKLNPHIMLSNSFLGSLQITLTVPNGGFDVSNLVSELGIWEVEHIVRPIPSDRVDYLKFLLKIKEKEPILKEEITLEIGSL